LPIKRKNWVLTEGESFNFSIDYVSEDDGVFTAIPLTNYEARLVFFSTRGNVIETFLDGTSIWRDALLGHIGVDVSDVDMANLRQNTVDYIIYLDNIYDVADKDAILRGRVEIV